MKTQIDYDIIYLGGFMESYKEKYDYIMSKLLELEEKKQQFDDFEEEMGINLEKKNTCKEEYEKLKDKKRNMRCEIAINKHRKCFQLSTLLTFGFAAVCGLVVVLYSKLLMIILMIVLFIIGSHFMLEKLYFGKVNNDKYLYGELESSSEYKKLLEQIRTKEKELEQFCSKDEMLAREMSHLSTEINCLNAMICGFVDSEQTSKEDTLAIEETSELDSGLVRRQIKKTERKNSD